MSYHRRQTSAAVKRRVGWLRKERMRSSSSCSCRGTGVNADEEVEAPIERAGGKAGMGGRTRKRSSECQNNKKKKKKRETSKAFVQWKEDEARRNESECKKRQQEPAHQTKERSPHHATPRVFSFFFCWYPSFRIVFNCCTQQPIATFWFFLHRTKKKCAHRTSCFENAEPSPVLP